MKFLVSLSKGLIEKGLLPDGVIRFGMRQLLRQKLIDESQGGPEVIQKRLTKLIEDMRGSPVAVNTKDANEQHYELPTEFFQLCLGKQLKYSSCYYALDTETLDQAEDDMLSITCKRAELENGQQILELGCGWGSLSLFMAAQFPQASITSVSNSKTQKAYIDSQSAARGLKNLEIITSDMNTFHTHKHFDRVVSIEMFEHMRNWGKLLEKVSNFLKTDGELFIHIFTHRDLAYFYDEADDNDWIAKYFFTGGIMPSDDLLLHFQEYFQIENHWRVSGQHYQRTSEAWLKNMDAHKEEIMPILKKTYGEAEYNKWWVYWRVFFMACAELWGYSHGNEWLVSHYRLKKR